MGGVVPKSRQQSKRQPLLSLLGVTKEDHVTHKIQRVSVSLLQVLMLSDQSLHPYKPKLAGSVVFFMVAPLGVKFFPVSSAAFSELGSMFGSGFPHEFSSLHV